MVRRGGGAGRRLGARRLRGDTSLSAALLHACIAHATSSRAYGRRALLRATATTSSSLVYSSSLSAVSAVMVVRLHPSFPTRLDVARRLAFWDKVAAADESRRAKQREAASKPAKARRSATRRL